MFQSIGLSDFKCVFESHWDRWNKGNTVSSRLASDACARHTVPFFFVKTLPKSSKIICVCGFALDFQVAKEPAEFET